jgi:Family of unknown function (DUF5519)
MQKPFVLPGRKGVRPRTGPSIPHQQLSQIAPIELQDVVWERMNTLEHIVTGQSYVSMPDSKALHILPMYAKGPEQAFFAGTEFAHLHGPSDGSLHLTLSPKDIVEVLAKGWGESHPLARRMSKPGLVMVFGPRDKAELEIVWEIIQRSYANAATPIDND